MPGGPNTVGAFLAALRPALQTRYTNSGTLQAVKAYLVPPAADEQPAGDFIVLVRDKIVQKDAFANATKTRKRDQDVTIPGALQAYGTTKIGGDTAFQVAMDRADAILDELVLELRDNVPQVGQQTRSGLVGTVDWTPYAVEKGGWIVRGEFSITYATRVS